MTFFFLFIELATLYLLSRRVIGTLYRLLQKITRSRPIAIWIVSIIFFPGTVIHELAHLFTAEILGVRTGKLTLVPESLEGSEIKAGGVMIAESDPFRRTMIGLAPVSVGIIVLCALSYFLPIVWQDVLTDFNRGIMFSRVSLYSLFFILYSLFATSNSMFSSKEDMKGVIPFAIIVGLFVAAGYVAGFRIGLTGELLTKTLLVIETLVGSLGIVLGVNLLVLFATSILLSLHFPHHK